MPGSSHGVTAFTEPIINIIGCYLNYRITGDYVLLPGGGYTGESITNTEYLDDKIQILSWYFHWDQEQLFGEKNEKSRDHPSNKKGIP
jgi:hypothetical protein